MIPPIALALLAAVQPMSAQECALVTTQMELTACAQQDFERADAELNRLWREIIEGARETDRTPGNGRTAEDNRSEAAILRRAQRAWLAYRDAQCEYEGLGNRGGSLEPMDVNLCLARLTRERIAMLAPQQAVDQ
ncbi:MAG: hypothetical protein QOD42_277 [Sphingomonadales bacterium]|jgi:uncharacterized protein YecT (DUF1311 family)|nr:hypothetical protein [Sphingomonadales bacterium]